MNSFIIKKNKNRVADIEKIYLWLHYVPLGQILTKSEKRVLASYINLYFNTKNAYKAKAAQDALVYNYIFGAEGNRQICSDAHIKVSNLQVIKFKLRHAKCILVDRDGSCSINKEVIPKFEKNGDIIINTTIRFV